MYISYPTLSRLRSSEPHPPLLHPQPSPRSQTPLEPPLCRHHPLTLSPRFPPEIAGEEREKKKQKTKHKLRIKEEVLKDGRVKEGGTGEKNNSGDLKGAACSLFTLVLCFLAL